MLVPSVRAVRLARRRPPHRAERLRERFGAWKSPFGDTRAASPALVESGASGTRWRGYPKRRTPQDSAAGVGGLRRSSGHTLDATGRIGVTGARTRERIWRCV